MQYKKTNEPVNDRSSTINSFNAKASEKVNAPVEIIISSKSWVQNDKSERFVASHEAILMVLVVEYLTA